jgi:L-asparaginase II
MMVAPSACTVTRTRARRICSELFDVRSNLAWAIDGCAVPTYLFTLRQLALGFARLTTPGQRLNEPNAVACHRVTKAMTAEPDMVGGIDARDSLLMRGLPGVLIAKGVPKAFREWVSSGGELEL